MFVSDQVIQEIASDMQPHFEFELHSQSSITEIASVAQDELANRGLPTRRSLAIVVAKVALMIFRGTVSQTKQALKGA
tara:strand:+ start:1452 stop:1685 length:234 start_codon:yes stop_codon:yes gene_type:complete